MGDDIFGQFGEIDLPAVMTNIYFLTETPSLI